MADIRASISKISDKTEHEPFQPGFEDTCPYCGMGLESIPNDETSKYCPFCDIIFEE